MTTMNTFQIPFMVRTLDSNETVEMFHFTTPSAFELGYVIPELYKQGAIGGSETLQMRIHTSTDFTKVYAASDTLLLSSLGLGTNYVFRPKFTFNRENINPGKTYYLTLKTNNYTRNGDTYYLSVMFDYPFTTNTGGSNATATYFYEFTKKAAIFGYK